MLGSVSAGLGTTAGTSLVLKYVGSGVRPPPGNLGSKAEAEFRRCCTGNSRLRVPTYRTSRLVSRNNSCCTPSDQLITFGSTWSGMIFPVAARASACVVGGTFTCNKPPPTRNPGPLGHQEGGLLS